MSTVKKLLEIAINKDNFSNIECYVNFLRKFIEFIDNDGMQATIISQKTPKYQFFQYKSEANFNITRPINNEIFLNSIDMDKNIEDFYYLLKHAREVCNKDDIRFNFNKVVYSCQQSIGAILDALPASKNNIAKKLNGDYFEFFIRNLINCTGIIAKEGTESISIFVNKDVSFPMKFQNDIMIYKNEELRAIGSIKTSSKDRISKVFIDKFLYNKLTELDLPHFAIFLNDVQRKGKIPNLSISNTFLTAHFKGYTIKLCPLDGVYFCDKTSNMLNDKILEREIFTLDKFFVEDIWKFCGEKKVLAR